MEFLISILSAVLLAEVYAWLPRISLWFIERAVSRLVPDEQERYREEWRAHLADIPNSLVGFVHAISLALPQTAERINRDNFDSKLEEIEAALEGLARDHQGMSDETRVLLAKVEKERAAIPNLKNEVQKCMLALKEMVPPTDVSQAHTAKIETLIDSYAQLGSNLVLAIDRATAITSTSVNKLSGWVAEIESDLKGVSEKRSQLRSANQRRLKDPATFAASIVALERELGSIRTKLAGGPIEDDNDHVRKQQHKKLIDAITAVINHQSKPPPPPAWPLPASR